MRARDVMSLPVVTVNPTTTAEDAARLLCSHGFTALPVVDGSRLTGIVTEADLIVAPTSAEQPSGGRRTAPVVLVRDVMTTPVESLTPDAELPDIARIMLDVRIRCLPVVDGLRVVGVVTRRDLLRAGLADADQDLADQISRQLALVDTPNRWRVSVRSGVADIEDYGTDTRMRDRAAQLASEVPGILGVNARHQPPDPF